MPNVSQKTTRFGLYALSFVCAAIAVRFLMGKWFIAAAVVLVIGLHFLPALRDRLDFHPSSKVTKAVVVIGLIGLVWAVATDATRVAIQEEEEAQAEAARAEAERVRQLQAEFSQRKSDLLATIEGHIEAGEWDEAQAAGARYEELEDPDLAAALDRAREGQIVEELRSVPASELRRNWVLYGQLVALDEDNERYRERKNHYEALLEQRAQERREAAERAAAEERAARAAEAAERSERVAAFGEPPEASAWDGTYRVVRDYLRQVANDPESIDIDACTDVYHVEDRGWLVGCDYRGRNAFGGMIRNSNWFIIRHGRVVSMEDASAFRP